MVTAYDYDDFGNRTSITVDDLATAVGGSLPARTTTLVYGELNASNAVIADNGRFPVKVTNAKGRSAYRQYDARFGAVIRSEDPNGLATSFSYDRFGRALSETRPDGTRSEVIRAWCGSTACSGESTQNLPGVFKTLTHSTGAPAAVMVSDRLGRTILAAQVGFDGTPVITETEYDNQSRVQRVSRPYLFTTDPESRPYWAIREYDVLGRVTKETLPGAIVTETHYLPSGTTQAGFAYRSAIRVTNAKSQSTTRYFNALGQLVRAQDALGTPTDYTYDALGELDTVIVNSDAATTITNTYDLLGRKTAMTDPDTGHWTYAYDAFGELRAQTDAKGVVTTFVYDALGRPSARTENATEVSTFSYDTATDGIGRLASMTDPEGEQKAYTRCRPGIPRHDGHRFRRMPVTIPGHGSRCGGAN